MQSFLSRFVAAVQEEAAASSAAAEVAGAAASSGRRRRRRRGRRGRESSAVASDAAAVPSDLDLYRVTDRLLVGSRPRPALSSPTYDDPGRDTWRDGNGGAGAGVRSGNENDDDRVDDGSDGTKPNDEGKTADEEGQQQQPQPQQLNQPEEQGKDRFVFRHNKKPPVRSGDPSASGEEVGGIAGNDPAALVTFLDRNYRGGHGGGGDDGGYALFNLSDEVPDDRAVLLFRRRIVNLPYASLQNCEIPSYQCVLDVCYALSAWLDEDEDGVEEEGDPRRRGANRVAVLYCGNGKTRTALVTACYLKFVGKVDFARDGFCHFVEVTTASGADGEEAATAVPDPEALLDVLPASLRTFFDNFDRMVELKRCINTKPLLLRAITLQGIPVEEKPCLEIYEYSADSSSSSSSQGDGQQQHRLVYSSHRPVKSDTVCGSDSQEFCRQQSSQWAEEEGFYNVNCVLKGDFLLRCRFGGDHYYYDSDDDDDDNSNDATKVIFRYANTVGFLGAGFYELPITKVDLMRRYAHFFETEESVAEDFLVSLVFESHWDTEFENEGGDSTFADVLRRCSSSLPSVLSGYDARERGWHIIAQCHSAQPIPADIDRFLMFAGNECYQIPRHFVSLALQLHNFDYEYVQESLTTGMISTWWSIEAGENSKNNSHDDTLATAEDEETPALASTARTAEISSSQTNGVDERRRKRRQEMIDLLDEADVWSKIHPSDLEAGGLLWYKDDNGPPPIVEDDRNGTGSLMNYAASASPLLMPHSGDVINAFGMNREALEFVGRRRPLEMGSRPLFPVIPTRSQALPLPIPPLEDPRNKAATELLLKLNHPAVQLQDIIDLSADSKEWNHRGARDQAVFDAEIAKEQEEKKAEEKMESTEERKSSPPDGSTDSNNDDQKDDIPLKDDPKYEKYFRMLAKGLPGGAVRNALQRDGHDPTILDLNPELSLASQKQKDENTGGTTDGEPPLKDDPKFEKYFRMLAKGLPVGAVRNALSRDGFDPSIADLDPEKCLASQTPQKRNEDAADGDPPLKKDPKFEKYFRMLAKGLPSGAVRNALIRDGLDASIVDLDPEKSLASQMSGKGGGGGGGADNIDAGPALKDDPMFQKYFRMIKTGLPPGAVRNAMQRDGLDPSILDLDPEKSLTSQSKQSTPRVDTGIPLRDDPEFKKYFTMLAMGSKYSVWS